MPNMVEQGLGTTGIATQQLTPHQLREKKEWSHERHVVAHVLVCATDCHNT